MKKFYILSLCALMGVSAAMAEGHFKTRKGSPRKASIKPAADAAPLWRAESESEYLYMDGEWILVGTTNFTYDAAGNAIVQQSEDEDGIFRLETTFNEYGKPLTMLQTADFGYGGENVAKRTYRYDERLHDFCVERMGYDWQDDDWVMNYLCETNEITRNADGNITEIMKSLPYIDKLYPAYRSMWNYDETTGKANEYRYYVSYSFSELPEWELDDNLSYCNIEWETTDGQMTAASLSEMLTGANKVKSADVYYDDELDGHVIVEYSAENESDYLYRETFADPSEVGFTSQFETTDKNGSFRITECEYFDEEGEPTVEPTYKIVSEVTVDEHGNAVLEELYETFDGITELVDAQKAEYLYDGNGNVTQVTYLVYDYETEEFVPESKIVYGTYADVTSVKGIDAAAATDFTVYNLQGILLKKGVGAEEIGSLPAGLYIINGKKQLIRR